MSLGKLFILIALNILIYSKVNSQNKSDSQIDNTTALEGVIVEKYYTSTAKDCKDTSDGHLPVGSVTYRIYIDMKPGYRLQAVYGVTEHPMFIKTTTKFFNSTLGGESGDQIEDNKLNSGNVALDSWATVGVATKTRFGVLKTEDKDSSIIKRKGLEKKDGLLLAGTINKLLLFGLNLDFFNNTKDADYFFSDNGSWATVGGGKGQTNDNRVLIAQLTTNGKLSFEFNVQLGTPDLKTVQFVAKNPQGQEVLFPQLSYDQSKIQNNKKSNK